MESITYHGISMGEKLYSLRMVKRMSQEQLAAILGVSPAAVSKWERDLSKPSIEMLWALADLFACSIDELVGRTQIQVEKIGIYDEAKLRLAVIGEDLLQCSEISRAQGLLAVESCISGFKGGSRFLAFAIPYALDLFMKQLGPDEIFSFLGNYAAALPEEERAEGKMIVAALRKIFSGESTEIVRELIASFIGMEYREKNAGKMREVMQYTREEILEQYQGKKCYSKQTDLLEEFAGLGDYEIRLILRNTDNMTLTAAMAGASGKVVKAFLSNLSERMLYFIHEDMIQWSGTEEDILEAQKKVLELGRLCLREAEKDRNTMPKKLSEMTLEELWQLFPIFLVEHDERWKLWYNEECQRIYDFLAEHITDVKISHIGSTAIDHIWAKSIIDILVEIPLTEDIRKVKDVISQNGYLCMSENEKKISFNKGYTENGFEEKVFHLHLRYLGDNDEVYFRDYLNEHPAIAKEYEKLKLSLWKTYEHDRDGYTEAKREFVSEYTKKAREKYKGRYL